MENLLKKLDLTSLRLFVAVCQEKNIARAAEREFIASSAVSRRIAEIEGLIGLPVIERQSRGIAVTPVGETVLRYAQMIIADIEAMSAELSLFQSGAKGSVRVVANLSSIVQFLPEDVAAFERVFPNVHIDLEERHTADVLRLIAERGADLGICNATGLDAAEVEHAPYRSDRLALAVPRAHRFAAAARVAFAEVTGERFVGLHDESALTRQLAAEAARQHAQLDVKIRVSSLDALCRMVHAGLGVAIVPEQTAQLYLGTLDIAIVPLSDAWAVRQLVIVYKHREQLSASAAALVRFLAQEVT
jgi:DNA-binding transcriptional LysR family regulator